MNMRLIDADALEREMYRKSFEVDDGRQRWNSGLWIRYKIFEEAIGDAPTVEAEPVRKAHWIYHPDWEEDGECCYECSECGMGSEVDYDFCMKCGSKMIGMETAKRKEE